MKRLLSLFTIIMTCASVSMAAHLEFMGIPINGSISHFQSKLIANGLKYDKQMSEELPKGLRAFTGQFAGEEPDNIVVKYNTKNNIVANVLVFFIYDDKDDAIDILEQFEELYDAKYPQANAQEGTDENGNRIVMYEFEEGVIGLSIEENDDDTYSAIISYIDYANHETLQNNIMDDL